MRLLCHTLCLRVLGKPWNKYAHSNFTLMREAYLQNSRFERFLVFQAKSKANASFNQYVIARRYARFSCLTSGEGRYVILFFICCLVILCLSRTCPVLVLYLSCTYPELVRSPRGGYILVNNSSVVNSILAKANHFLPRSLRLAPIW